MPNRANDLLILNQERLEIQPPLLSRLCSLRVNDNKQELLS